MCVQDKHEEKRPPGNLSLSAGSGKQQRLRKTRRPSARLSMVLIVRQTK